ncbi:Protein CBG28022 [Caenorhabditis briggsae]|uniref:Protein CBG28022 n=1 Tax=Caenorhabditis briggsae TaxID=6238 RepID=B6IG18_CAEBR|nr:Protein CBG28022 [Caenorhabditis briggsae]CAR98848.1 Protein CBG28022 [Caenorhabditis briggsae]
MLKPAVSHSEKDQLEINTAYRIKEQNIFQLNMKLQKWERLDLSDSFTRNLIIEINADESKMQKFNEDVLRNQFDPRIVSLFLKSKFLPMADASNQRFTQPTNTPVVFGKSPEEASGGRSFSQLQIIPPPIPSDIPAQENNYTKKSKDCPVFSLSNHIPLETCQIPPQQNRAMPPQNHQVAAPSNFMRSKNCLMPNPQNCLIPQQNCQMPPTYNWPMPPPPSRAALQNSPVQSQNNQMVPPNSSWTSQNIQIPPGNVSMPSKIPQLAPFNVNASETPFLMQNQNFPMPFQQNSMSSPFNPRVFPNSELPPNSPMTSGNLSVVPPRNPTVPHQNLPITFQTSHMEPRNISMVFQNNHPKARNVPMMPQNKIVEPSPMAPFHFKGPPPNIQAPQGFPPILCQTFQGPPPSIQGPGGYSTIPPPNIQSSEGYWPTPPRTVQGPPSIIQAPLGLLPIPSQNVQGTPHNSHGPPPYSQRHTHGFPHGPPKNQNHGNGNEPQSMRRSIPVVKVLAPHSKPNVDDIMKIDTPSTTSSNDTVPDWDIITRFFSNHGDVTANLMDTQKARNLNQQEIHKNEQDFLTDPIPEVPVGEPSVCERHDAKTESASIPLEVVSTQSKNKTDRNPDNLAQLPITTEVSFLVDTTVEITDSEHEPKSILTPEADEPTLPRKETVKDDVATSIVPVTLSESDVFQNSPRLCKNLHAKPTAADRGVMGKKEHAKPDTSKCKGKKNRNGHKAPSPSPKPSMTSRYAISGSPTKPNISSQVEKKPENVEHKKVITAIIINAPALKIESNKQNDVNGSETLKTKPEDEPSCSLQPEENNGKKKNKKAKKTKSGKETNVEEDFDELLKRFQLEDEKNKISDGDTKTKSAPKTTKRRTIKQYRQEKAEAEAEAAKAAEKAASPIEPAIQTLEDLYEFENFDEEYCVVTDIQNIHYPTDLPAIPEEVVTRVQKQIEEFVADVKECIREGNRLPYWPDLEFKLEDSLDLEKVNQDVLDFFSSKFSDLRRSDTPWAQFRRLFYSELVKAFVPQIWPVFAVLLEKGKNGSLNFMREMSIISKICNTKENKNLDRITYFSF